MGRIILRHRQRPKLIPLYGVIMISDITRLDYFHQDIYYNVADTAPIMMMMMMIMMITMIMIMNMMTATTRKHSSRRRTARLPSVCASQ